MRRLIDKYGVPQSAEPVDVVMPEPMTVRIDAASKLTGISRSQLYELIQAGRLETVKVGRINLIRYRSLKELVGH